MQGGGVEALMAAVADNAPYDSLRKIVRQPDAGRCAARLVGAIDDANGLTFRGSWEPTVGAAPLVSWGSPRVKDLHAWMASDAVERTLNGGRDRPISCSKPF